VYFGLPDEALALREGLREVLADVCTPATIRAAWEGSDSAGLWKELGAFGLLGLLVPEERGGLALDELSLIAALEESGYAGVPGPLVETVCALPELDLAADGSCRVAIKRDGPVTHATTSTHVFATPTWSLLRTADCQLDPIETVDRSRQLAYVTGASLELPHTAADTERLTHRATLGTAAFLLGLARRQLDMTVEYLRTRKQFGVAIGTYQGLKHPLAEAVVGTEFAWPPVLMAAQALATGADDTALRVSHAKAAASDAAYRMSRVCLQAHGAIGYTMEYDLHLFAKRTWALANDWGTAAEHRRLVARELST
jgi:alkylation response protein AidB-like acyl-CoA dehydrogenase